MAVLECSFHHIQLLGAEAAALRARAEASRRDANIAGSSCGFCAYRCNDETVVPLERVRGVVARVAQVLLPAALPVVLASCDSKVDAADEAPPALRAALAARTIYPAKREEWRSDITAYTDSTMVPRVFRASLTTVALLQSMPTRISLFELNGKGMLLSTRPARIDSVLNAEVPRDIVAPSDLSRVTDDGNGCRGQRHQLLVRESIGGFVFSANCRCFAAAARSALSPRPR
jgi:hypothetical protein